MPQSGSLGTVQYGSAGKNVPVKKLRLGSVAKLRNLQEIGYSHSLAQYKKWQIETRSSRVQLV